jgi:ABC-type anion transport system duplicated permease subunit
MTDEQAKRLSRFELSSCPQRWYSLPHRNPKDTKRNRYNKKKTQQTLFVVVVVVVVVAFLLLLLRSHAALTQVTTKFRNVLLQLTTKHLPPKCHRIAVVCCVVLLLLLLLLLFVLKHNSRADLTNKAGVKASKPQVKLIGRRDHQQVQLNHLHTPPLGLNPRTFL